MFDFVEAYAAPEFRPDLLTCLYRVRTGHLFSLYYISPGGRHFTAKLEGGRVTVRDYVSEEIEYQE